MNKRNGKWWPSKGSEMTNNAKKTKRRRRPSRRRGRRRNEAKQTEMNAFESKSSVRMWRASDCVCVCVWYDCIQLALIEINSWKRSTNVKQMKKKRGAVYLSHIMWSVCDFFFLRFSFCSCFGAKSLFKRKQRRPTTDWNAQSLYYEPILRQKNITTDEYYTRNRSNWQGKRPKEKKK